ncbi:MAG: HAD family hydrolase [Gemmatimonadota bacterium]|nr:HAD family hydrolase [Gemmatimonadota bacterium]
MTAPLRPAVFLDRDGTIITDVEYIAKPEDVELVHGAASAISRLNDAGVPVIVVTNQSGIGRGYFTFEDFVHVEARIAELLREEGAQIDAVYICPHAPSHEGLACACRKPGTALFREAAAEHALDLERSWYVGDRWRDIEPAFALGGIAALVPAPGTPPEDVAQAETRNLVRRSLAEVVEMILTTD